MPDLSLVVPAWVVSQRVVECAPQVLDAYRDSGVDLELIVVDNGSPNLMSRLRESADVAIRFEENQGYPGGVNAGLEAASAPVVGVGSIDILMPPNWGRAFLDAAPMVASPRETGDELRHVKQRGDFWGAMFTFPAEALETVGLMDDVLFAGFADRDYGVRLAQAGYEFTRVDVEVDHLASNHAHRYAMRNVEGHDAQWSRELAAFRRMYGASEWLEWMRMNGKA